MDAKDQKFNPASTLAAMQQEPFSGAGRVYPSEVRALVDILSTHLQRQPEQTDMARLRNTASGDPNCYLLFFDDIYLGSVTRIPATTDEDRDEFRVLGPGM